MRFTIGPAAHRRWSPAAALCVLAALLAGGCDAGDDASAGAAPAIDSLADQTDRPLLGRGVVSVAERMRVGDAGLAELERPVDLEIDRAGSIYVLDVADTTRIARFDSTGRLSLRFDRREPGIMRIARAGRMAVAPWNTILLVDRGQNLLTSFLTLGTFVGAVEIHGIGINVLPLPAFGEFYLHKWDPETSRAYVIRARTPLDSLGTVYSIGIPAGQSVRKQARDVAFQTTTDRQGRLYVAFADAYPVRILDPSGETVRLVGLDREPVPKSEARIDAERDEIANEIRRAMPDVSDRLLAQAAEVEPTFPMIEELVVDPSGRLWVRTHREGAGATTAYDVFNERGEYLARVDVPGVVVRTAFGPDGTLWAIDGIRDDERAIVAYEVRLGEPAADAG